MDSSGGWRGKVQAGKRESEEREERKTVAMPPPPTLPTAPSCNTFNSNKKPDVGLIATDRAAGAKERPVGSLASE